MRVLFHDAIGRDTVRLPDNDAAFGIDGGRVDTGLLQRQAVVDPQVPRLVDGNNRNVGGNCIELLASWVAFFRQLRVVVIEADQQVHLARLGMGCEVLPKRSLQLGD